MPIYTPPTEDMQYLLHEVMQVSQSDIPGYDELERDFTAAVLEEAGKISAEVLAPLNTVGDRQGCTLENDAVRTPEGFKSAYDQMCEGGWIGLDADPAYGGQGMPYLLNTAVGEMFVSANMAFNMYQGLTHGAMSAIHVHGSDEQKETYLPKMIAGTWSGTMNLTEPHCGTDLGLIRTKAEPQADGSYAITGTKIWISAGEHNLTDNIVHLVLAKIPGGPDGVKGISLFIVPKFLPDADGNPGQRNALKCVGLEHKMGIHGNATCVMSYEGATGFLVGEAHKGMRAMFTMMNEARIGVGLQGYAQGVVAYQNAVAWAQERLQGRAVTGPANPDGPADSIMVHPDVRRNLMHQKSFVEGARAFAFWGAEMIDRAHRAEDAQAEAMISLLTPVIKGFLTDKGFETTVLAQQTYGGTGFTRDAGAEQFVRDARITMIYEGTNGIQSLDLVGRKLGQNGGQAVMAFFDLVKGFIKENEADEELKADFLDPLKAASKDLQEAAMYFMAEGMKNPANALAGSYDFLHLFGHVCLGLMWAKMARASRAALAAGTDNPAFHETKLATGRYYMARQLPATALHLARIRSGGDSVMALDTAAF
ncbi:acyl-CoA dehydrogenase C-terminal domain-containing protein [Rhodovulum adriaticum]|uniref:3-methylmercaptopropionyl-CoA dehydrogenase n=1 Tax=Rhodovulum adriaticum TaxID=35804 RepID=A0A4R2NI15_RHOAD|nr:acyl-CoA dehydrogenase C-terminal domain-containing protein [Rhodovulum adriaticum]MBK1635813.1 acyl-CoA dehydrogenase [Rhodovulum adriaticum]TCP21021.1 alkylation response protein AidB-like acyl-CoA dehydrogenase [Rhodovulum adriaticum]